MTTRNNYIERIIRSEYSEIPGARRLPVFFISSTAYQKYRLRAVVRDLPIRGSGIPLLRQHCHKIPSQAQFRIGHHFLTVSLRSLIQQVQLWHAGGSQETLPNHATVQRLLESLQGDLKLVSRSSSILVKTVVPVLFDIFNFMQSTVTQEDILSVVLEV